MSLGVTDRFALMVAMFPDELLIIAFCPVGTEPPLQLVASFQSVLVVPDQSAALAAERPKETTMAEVLSVNQWANYIPYKLSTMVKVRF